MEPTAPNDATPRANTITNLRGNIIEVAGYRPEITVTAESVGANLWTQLVSDTQLDLRERYTSVIRNRRTNKLSTTPIIVGEPENNSSKGATIGIKPQPLLSGLLNETVSHIHSHPLDPNDPELNKLKTSIPSTRDIAPLTNLHWKGSMVIVDRGGAHLLIRAGEAMRRDIPPPPDLIEKVLKEVGEAKGTVVDIQRRINGLISEYGISYYYRESLTPDAGDTVTFKKP